MCGVNDCKKQKKSVAFFELFLVYYIKDRRAADHQDKRAPDRQVWGEICFTSISAAPADHHCTPTPPVHLYVHSTRAPPRMLPPALNVAINEENSSVLVL